MTEKSLIIIGAGLAGLSTGCFAQMNGYQSHIFEHHSQPGGVAAAWKRKNYLIDGGIHFVMGHKPGTALYELYGQLGILPANRFLDLTTYGRFTDEASGRSLEVTQDLDRLAEDLKTFSAADARIVDELVAGARAMQGLDMSEVGLSKPPELMGPLDQLKEMWAMRRLLKYVIGKYGRSIADYAQAVQDPQLRALIENLFLPEVPVYFVLMVLALLADGQLGLIEGGSWDFVRIFNYSPRFAPPGKTVAQVEFETEWDYWNDLQQKDRARYDAEKGRVATEVLERLETHYPGISSQVEVTDVATPYTTWRYTLNHKGAWEGWLMTPDAIRTPIERTLPGLADFYMAGQWVMPGGGVPPCLYSGRHAVQLLCRQDGKPFTTALP